MRPSLANTFPLPDSTVGQDATPIARGTDIPVRVVLVNTGPVLAFLAFSTQDLQFDGGASSGTFELAAGAREVFVLAPGQVLFGSGSGPGGRVSAVISDALPLV